MRTLPPLPSELAACLRPPGASAGGGDSASTLDFLAGCPEHDTRRCPLLDKFLAPLPDPGGRYAEVRKRTLQLARLGDQGHYGVPAVLDELQGMFTAEVDGEPGRNGEREYTALLDGAVAEVLADPTPEQDRGCCDSLRQPEWMTAAGETHLARAAIGNGQHPPAADIPAAPPVPDGMNIDDIYSHWLSETYLGPDFVYLRPYLEQRRAAEQAARDAQAAAGPPPTLKLVQASGIAPERVRWLWQDKLKLGGLALLTGDVGLGKSTVGIDITARLTKGTLPGEHYGKPQHVIICATEDEWADTVVPRLMAAGADLTRVWQLTTAQEYGAELTLPVQVPELAERVTESGAKLIILDPLMSRLHGALDSHKDAEVRRALEPLVKMAGEAGVTVLGLIHVNKGGDSSGVNRVMGSKAFTAVARSVLFAAPLLTQDASGETYVLACMKNNNARHSAESYRIEPVMLAAPGGITSTRIHWLGALESFMLDAELAEAGRRRGASAVDKAAEWLTGYLTQRGGRADSREVKKAGREAGHSVSALKRAMAEALVTAENTLTKPPRSEWVLDDYAPPSGSAAAGDPPAANPDPQWAHARGGSPGVEPTSYGEQQENIYEPTKPTVSREYPPLQSVTSGLKGPGGFEPTSKPSLTSGVNGANPPAGLVGSKPPGPPAREAAHPPPAGSPEQDWCSEGGDRHYAGQFCTPRVPHPDDCRTCEGAYPAADCGTYDPPPGPAQLPAYPPIPGSPEHGWCRASDSSCQWCDQARTTRVADAKRLKAAGHTVREIAAQLGVSTTTARDDLKR